MTRPRSSFPHFSLMLGVLIVAMSQAPLSAAPSNDGFASAAVLPAALPSTTSGSNVGATTEAGELLPPLTKRTVWWSWTPSVNGWVRVSTRGDVDTFLTVFTGSTLATLTRQAFNDDFQNGLFDTPTGESQVVFFATLGKTYYFQVGGYRGWEGAFSLDLTATPTPPQLVSLSFTPSSAEVSSNAASLSFDLKVTHPAGLRVGRLSLFRPDGRPGGDASISALSRIAGTASSGTYRVSIPIQPHVLPGAYAMWVDLTGQDGSRSVFGERTPFPSGVTSSVPVINKGVIDAQPPLLTSLTIAPVTADVTTVAKVVTLTVRIVDSVSGVIDFSSSLQVTSPAGDSIGGADLSRRNRVSGDSFDGTYAVKVTLPAGAPPGDYRVHLHLIDSLGNDVGYGPDLEVGEQAIPAGMTDHFTVINSGSVDTQPPVLKAAAVVPATVNIAEFESVHLRVSVQDSRSGTASTELAGASFGLRPVSGGAVLPMSMSLALTSGSPQDGVWEGTASPPEPIAVGDYLIVGIELVDALGNKVDYGPASLGLTAYPAGVNPIVTIVNKPLDGPYVTWLKAYPNLKGASAFPGADPDGDGLSNLVELALGTHPLISSKPGGPDPNATNAFHVYRLGNRIYMDYTLSRTNLGTGPKAIEIAVEESTDLKSWSGAQQLILGGGHYSAFISINDPHKWLRFQAYDPTSYPP